MNSAKYKDKLYDVREILDLRELLDSSAKLFASKNAFLVKDKVAKKFVPISYAQFRVDVNALGTSFMRLGLKGKKIAVIGENSYQWVVTYLATTNGTGVIVPIDRELKTKEILNLLNRAEVSAVVCSSKLSKTIDEIKDQIDNLEYIIEMDLSEDIDGKLSFDNLIKEGRIAVSEGDDSFITAEIDREALCSILFTSGTTGMAKGVMLSHKNITANVYNMSKYVKIVDDGVGLSVLPMHHSYEMTCHVFTGLYQGIAIAICEGLKYIQKNLEEVNATVMLAVPLIFETMHKKIWKQSESQGKAKKMAKMVKLSKKTKLYNNQKLIRKIFAPIHKSTGNNIHQFIAGGAAINPKVIEDYEAMGFPMIQGYGMTENAPIIAVNKDRYSKADSVGMPVPGTDVKIIGQDETGMGEIIVKGPSVMIGYYNNEEATAEAIKDGWLYTGDYGYMDDEGFLYISGRKKNVIVTKNGKNIFPEEVEFYLSESDFIEEVLVHGIVDDRTGDTVVKAEIYPNYPLIEELRGEIPEEEIREFLKGLIDKINDQMPLYKRVKRFDIRKEEFEKTTTRKIKRYTEANFGEGDN
ncbi:MAG: AMP-binding protein [Anaerovoracaceae bacterium]